MIGKIQDAKTLFLINTNIKLCFNCKTALMFSMKQLHMPNPFGASIFYLSEVDSTMRAARSEFGDSPEHGLVISAGRQSAGRGRGSGREWQAGQDEGLLCTIVFKRENMKVPVSSIPIRAALAVSRLLKQDFQFRPRIKWPNDVLVEGRKICGILCESTSAYVYVGIGLNVLQDEFSSELRKPATSIFLEGGVRPEPVELLPGLLLELYKLLTVVQLPILVQPWLYRLDEEVTILEGDPHSGRRVSGIITGIGESGELRLLQKSGKIHSLYSGE